MRKKTKAFLAAAVIVILAFMCLSCAVPIPLLIPFVEVGDEATNEPVICDTILV